MSKFNSLLKVVKQEEQDFEWYPTTNEIISALNENLNYHFHKEQYSILDCGAGNAKVLTSLVELNPPGRLDQRQNKIYSGPDACYAIEKSQILIDAMPKEIFIVGTEFWAQTLLDKKVDVVFSNPPFGNFSDWSAKLIREANSKYVYLVIPSRWQGDATIKAALEARQARFKVIDTFDFEDAEERQARCRVDLVCIELHEPKKSYGRESLAWVDPFELWYDGAFSANATKGGADKSQSKPETFEEKINTQLVRGANFVQALQDLYQHEMETLLTSYMAISTIDAELLAELNVDLNSVMSGLSLKIKSLKDKYWKELFSNLSKVTDRLTVASREQLLKTLTSRTHVDFSESNAYAVLSWVLKNCNQYYDTQLVSVFEKMITEANIQLYKSNAKVFNWSWSGRPEDLSHFKIDHRIVLDRCGGILKDSFYSYQAVNGLEQRAADYLGDILTIANNLGFSSNHSVKDFEWSSGRKNVFTFNSSKTGKSEALMEVKAFLNGNIHIKYNFAFIFAWNVEMGRLKKWVRSASEASSEMDIPLDVAESYFNSNLALGLTELSNLLPAPSSEMGQQDLDI